MTSNSSWRPVAISDHDSGWARGSLKQEEIDPLVLPCDLLEHSSFGIRIRKLDPASHLRVLFSITSMYPRNDLYSSKSIFPKVPTNECRFRHLTFHICGRQSRLRRRGRSAPETDIVWWEEGSGIHDCYAVPSGKDLEWQEVIETPFGGPVIDKELDTSNQSVFICSCLDNSSHKALHRPTFCGNSLSSSFTGNGVYRSPLISRPTHPS